MRDRDRDRGTRRAGKRARAVLERARELREQDAFAPALPHGPQVDAHAIAADLRAARRHHRRMAAAFALAALVLACASLLLPYNVYVSGAFAPGDVIDCYVLALRTHVLPLFDPTQANLAAQARADFNLAHDPQLYDNVLQRGAVTLATVVCGFLLAVSGMLFQGAFRNPLAAPSMLGVSDGVNVGFIVFAVLGYDSVANDPSLYVACVYGCGVAVLLSVLLASRYATGGRVYSVFDMLLVGTVVAQLVSAVVGYLTNFWMDNATWENYYDLQQCTDTAYQPTVVIAVLALAAVTMLPVFLARFRLDLISFSDDEGRMLGVRPGALRAAALACGAAMQLAALASIGQVAMVSLAVPFLVRLTFGSGFTHQLLGNFLVGAVVLLACQALAHFLVFSMQPVPVGTVVNVCIIPFFVWMMALSKRGWVE